MTSENTKELQADNASGRCPLVVDLDGTLIRSDLLIETFFALLKRNIFYVLLVPFWLVKGKAAFKQEIARRVAIDVSLLPYQDSTAPGHLR